MKKTLLLLLILTAACSQKPKTIVPPWVPYDESQEIAQNASHQSRKMQFELIQSRVLDKNEIWAIINPQIKNFSEEDYQNLKPLIFNQDILSMQSSIKAGLLSYETLTQWYLYRIVKYENDKNLYLNSIIAINPNAVDEAIEKDKNRTDDQHPLYGMPVLLKDNINAEGMATTAGAHALLNNKAGDAFIVERIKEHGGIILGKTSLSEWANFLSSACPNGYSAVGGQSLNPYGRKLFDTGGSSSGSGTSMAANYAAAAVGTETSGSILSPSSKNSLVGLKPTVGLLSRGGIVPISATYDTPGPMTRSVIDNAILLSAMSGEDSDDPATKDNPKDIKYWEDLRSGSLQGLRFGVISTFLRDSIYKLTVEKIVEAGGIAITFDPERITFERFTEVLSEDMKVDLPEYLNKYSSKAITFRSVEDIVKYNLEDTLIRIPYGQTLFNGIVKTEISPEELLQIKSKLHEEGVKFFEIPMLANQLDVILSVNNRNAGYAATAQYPCLTVPMGYSEEGEPTGITFVSRQFEEDKLLKIAYAFEQVSRIRKSPADYN